MKIQTVRYCISSILLLFLFLPFSLFAQEEGTWKQASPSSQAYHEYRLKNTIPPYGLVKIKALIAQIKDAEDDSKSPLNQKAYLALPLNEKFTYHMIHAESYSQNCDAVPPIIDEDKKIFGTLPDAFNESSWSERQANFLKSQKDAVVSLIKESVNRSKRVGLNYKTALVEMNATETIPFLIEVYNRDHKDYDILTVLMLLMKNNEYKPFMMSTSFIKLYGDKSDAQSFINYNKANEELIISRAMAFYNGRK